MEADRKTYELGIIGGGPAGLTAAIYAGRSMIKTVIVERGMPGGQAATTHMIENYPGFPGGITGPELAQKMEEHAREFGVEMLMGEVSSVSPGDRKGYLLRTPDGLIEAKALIVAPGCREKRLNVPGEAELRGRGVSYCATCDGAFFRDRDVVVVGGGDSAIEEAHYLTRFASRVYIVHRRDRLRAAKVLEERVRHNNKVEFVWNSVVTGLEGEDMLESVKITNVRTQESSLIKANGIFIYIGLQPNTEFLRGVIELDEDGYVITDSEMNTSAKGIFGAGDARKKGFRQVSTAVGDGATAAMQAIKYLLD